MKKSKGKKEADSNHRRTRISQQDIPSYSLEKALGIPRALAENYGYKPASPLQVAKALGVQPAAGPFRMLTGAAIAYGLTSGGYNADQISIEPLGLRVLRPTQEGDDLRAKREALLKPRILREFLTKYDRAPWPRTDIGENVLIDLGVPPDRAQEVLELIQAGAESVGFITDINGRKYVDLQSIEQPTEENVAASEEPAEADAGEPTKIRPQSVTIPPASPGGDARLRRVFITHGKNRSFIDPLKKLLSFGELQAVVAIERETVAQPISDKVVNDMRTCGAAIIHVDDERRLMDSLAKEHVVLNENVLIEIGAAMALYGSRFILLVKDGIELPSNLSGLAKVRYEGDTLDGEATIKMLEAINDIKNHPLPGAAGTVQPRAIGA